VSSSRTKLRLDPATWARLLSVLTGVLILWWGLSWFEETRSFFRNATLATGSIVGLDPTDQRWIVSFLDSAGSDQEFTIRALGREPAYRLGDAVRVLHLPQHEPKLDSLTLWWAPVLVSLLGLTVLVFALTRSASDPSAPYPTLSRAARSTCIIAVLTVLGSVVPGACAGARKWPERTRCARDSDCDTFCDLGSCAPDLGRGFQFSKLGKACEMERAEPTRRASPSSSCGQFICKEGRCRSCTSSAECSAPFQSGYDCRSASVGVSSCKQATSPTSN
jgi:hypothetical protein